MAVPGIEHGAHYQVLQVTVRLNLRTPQAGAESFEVIVPVGGSQQWFLPDDDALDLAVLPFVPDYGRFDVIPFDTSMFATKDKILANQIDAGNNVMFAGYFYQWPGDKKIQPIVRQGVVAMMPDEDIKTTLQKPGHLFLADVHAFHGNSGSPLLVGIGGIRGNSFTAAGYLLLGIISGYYPEDQNITIPTAQVLTTEVHDNSGIATIVPAYELQTLLDSAPVQAARDAEIRRRTKTAQP